mgnify:CR=1 FL=1
MTSSMSKPCFIYCFTKLLASNDEHYNISLEVLNKSVNFLSGKYPYKIFTDSITADDIKSFSQYIYTVDTSEFKFLDDFKISLLPKLQDNEVLIDPDVLIYKELKVNLDADLIFDYKDKVYQKWYSDGIANLKGTLIYDKINSIDKLPFIPNIGFLKINNKRLLQDYTDLYYQYREDILDKHTDNYRGFSIILGQYLLGILLYEGNYSYISNRENNSGEVYVHLGGPQKYEKYKKYKKNKTLI